MTHITFTSLATSDHATEEDFLEWATWADCEALAVQHGHTVLGRNATSLTVHDPDGTDPIRFTDPSALVAWLGY